LRGPCPVGDRSPCEQALIRSVRVGYDELESVLVRRVLAKRDLRPIGRPLRLDAVDQTTWLAPCRRHEVDVGAADGVWGADEDESAPIGRPRRLRVADASTVRRP